MSEIKLEEVNITTRIKSLKLVDFSFENIQEDEQINFDINKYSFEQSVTLKILPSVKLLEVLYNTVVFSDENKQRKLGEISATGEFELVNMEILTKENEIKLPKELLAMYVGVMIATVRGLLIAKAEGTPMEGAIIPILNPMDFFNKPTEQ